MESSSRKSATPAHSLSTDEQIDICWRLMNAYRVTIESEIAERQRRVEAHLLSYHETGSLTDLHAALADYQSIRDRFDLVRGPSKVKSLPTT